MCPFLSPQREQEKSEGGREDLTNLQLVMKQRNTKLIPMILTVYRALGTKTRALTSTQMIQMIHYQLELMEKGKANKNLMHYNPTFPAVTLP